MINSENCLQSKASRTALTMYFGLIVLFMSAPRVTRSRNSQFGRVVKAWDLKSHGVTRAGSNPAADVLLQLAAFYFNFQQLLAHV